MNKIPIGISTQRSSVNSSFSTVKNCEFSSFYDTAQKQLQGKRFSYQEANHQQTSQKENKRDNASKPQGTTCLNHPNIAAMFSALQSSDDPMYLCERCAILVASKGFQINKVAERKMKRQASFAGDLKKDASDTFATIKMKKNQTLQKLEIFGNKLEKKADFLEEYFIALHQFIQREKTMLMREIMLRRKEIESLREQSNNFYLNLMQRVREINLETGIVSQHKAMQLGKELTNIKKKAFQIDYESLKYPIKVLNINQLCQEISGLIKQSEIHGMHMDVDAQFKLKCDEEHSEIRSLKLSFQEENNFTLNAQETNRTGQL